MWTNFFKYLEIWIDDEENIKEYLSYLDKKMTTYIKVIKSIYFFSENAILIINTWTTFIWSQFAY